MIKGINKNIIVVDPPKKSSFEKIFFIVKVTRSPRDSRDMLTEANRLIGDSLTAKSQVKKRTARKNFLFFALGALVGGSAIGILSFFISL